MQKLITVLYLCLAQPLFGQIDTVKQRQFDFWIGAWDVNLRIKQPDNTWLDQVKSIAHIYPILNGQAILELWNETSSENGIKGYSLRYFREDLDVWELWLNWPRKNRSSNGFLRGQFRHNRGDFYSKQMQGDSTTLISRYSFNDITPVSLRWDDSYSKDDGKTWTSNWIMEFSRKSKTPPELKLGQPVNTYSKGDRCDLPEFRVFERLEGLWNGAMKYKTSDKKWMSEPANLKTYKILEGCACISLLQSQNDEQFFIFNFNTSVGKFEQGTLTSARDAIYKSYFGTNNNNIIVLDGFDLATKERFDSRYEWRFTDHKVIMKEFEKKGEVWDVIREITLQKNNP